MTAEPPGSRDLLIEGTEPLTLPRDEVPDGSEWTLVRDTIGFECSSGEWLEGEWTGVPVFELLEAARVPAETTHVQFESADGDAACVPLADLDGAIVAVGAESTLPRFVSPHVVGPRTVKALSRVRPLALAPEEDRTEYERLPLDEE